MLSTLLLQVSDWAMFFGRFHPVLVHLPIGFLLLAAFLAIGRRFGKIHVHETTLSVILFWSAVSATLACGAGYLLSLGGGYEEELLDEHMWQGLGVAAFAWIAWAVKSEAFAHRIPFGPAFYLPAFGLATVLTMVAGHHGGSLTHGDGYLTAYTPEPFRSLAGIPPRQEQLTEIKPIANVPEAVVYRDIVQPILSVHCTQCHNATKKKGDLRMDTFEYLTKGGENGVVFVAGKSTESELLKRCLLPLDNDDHMPPIGKPQLSDNQIALLTWWIDQGAPVDKKVAELKSDDKIKPALASLSEGENAGGAGYKPTGSPVLSLKVPEPDEKAVQSLESLNLLVTPVASEQNLIEVSAVNAPEFSDAQVPLLTPLSSQIVWLKLGSTSITDPAITEISKLKNLNKLHLEYTGITDAGLKNLKNLPYLEYLNLIGTKVTDSGLQSLASLKAIKNVYVWKSAVTEAGIVQLRKVRPDLNIVTGLDETTVAAFLKAGKADSTRVSGKPTP
ncbi:c-type cytochrome domain-containing protein [Salmonirosea aquatica]|uniref:Ribonuclease inhibitor n=1 Tax=Salmonirosea aquatica TaxID=2654236 RepID=A0A7C9BI50_9BACT|nr:ribonuclease inhibitor [Cytophagaceae bacterium SJW1-29]